MTIVTDFAALGKRRFRASEWVWYRNGLAAPQSVSFLVRLPPLTAVFPVTMRTLSGRALRGTGTGGYVSTQEQATKSQQRQAGLLSKNIPQQPHRLVAGDLAQGVAGGQVQ